MKTTTNRRYYELLTRLSFLIKKVYFSFISQLLRSRKDTVYQNPLIDPLLECLSNVWWLWISFSSRAIFFCEMSLGSSALHVWSTQQKHVYQINLQAQSQHIILICLLISPKNKWQNIQIMATSKQINLSFHLIY